MKKLFYRMVGVAAIVLLLNACDKDVFDINSDPFKDQNFAGLLDPPISTYLAEQEGYEEYVSMLRYSNMFNALNQSNGVSFTAFVPNNEAMREFYQRRGVDSLQALTPEYARQFVLYHTVKDSILTEDFIKASSVENLNNDIISIQIDPEEAGEAMLNDEGRVIEMGVSAYNGKIYVLSRAMTPLVETVYDRIVEGGQSKIMIDALDATGWNRRLSTVVDTTLNQEGNRVVNHYYFTMLNVSDATFAKAGINSLADLKSKLRSISKEAVSEDSLLNQYVSYHILQSPYTTDALGAMNGTSTTRIWSSSAKNQVFTVTYDSLATNEADKYVLNSAGDATRFVTDNKNILAKNGYLHELDGWMPVWEPDQAEVLWDFADYPEIRNIVPALSYQPAEPVTTDESFRVATASCFDYEMGEAGTNNTDYKDIEYVPCKLNLKDANNLDRVVFNLGYMGKVTMPTPTIVRGKYRVELTYIYLSEQKDMYNRAGSNGGMLKLTFDDSEENTIFTTPYTREIPNSLSTGVYTTTLYEEIEFHETAAHKMSFVILDPAASTLKKFSLQFDCIRFIPIEE